MPQLTPVTVALHAWLSVVLVDPVQPLPGPPPPVAHVGVVHIRICVPVRLHVPGIVCVHIDQGAQVVAPHAPPVLDGVQFWTVETTFVAHAPLAQV